MVVWGLVGWRPVMVACRSRRSRWSGRRARSAGDIRAGDSYESDQYSQVELTSTQLAGGSGWARRCAARMVARTRIWGSTSGTAVIRNCGCTSGPAVRAVRDSYDSGPLGAGTRLTLSAVGSRIAFAEDGTERIVATDATLTGGAPGLMTYGAARADNWAGSNATAAPPPPLQIQYLSTDAHGVASYNVTSSDNGYGTHVLRVLAPTDPAPGVPHNFLYVLPVSRSSGPPTATDSRPCAVSTPRTSTTSRSSSPRSPIDPWYADNPNDANLQLRDLYDERSRALGHTEPRAALGAHSHVSGLMGHEQNWLIGFSKSGIGGRISSSSTRTCSPWPRPGTSPPTRQYDQFGPVPRTTTGRTPTSRRTIGSLPSWPPTGRRS